MTYYMVEFYAIDDVTASDCHPDFFATREAAEQGAKEFAKLCDRISAWNIIEINEEE